MRRKSLLNLSGVDWGDHTGRYPILYNCNIYFGCEHNCRYCYAKKIYYWKESWADAEPVDNAVELAKREVQNKKPGRIMFCSMCDPYQPIERKLELARKVLEVLVDSKFHVLIMTKSDMVMRDYDLLDGRENVEVGFTITSLNDISMWEAGAPGNTRRIEALKKIHDLGIKTFVSMEPTIPEETRPIEIMEALSPYVDRWIIGALNYMDVDLSFYRREVPEWAEYVDKKGLKVMWKKELKPYL